MNNRPQRYLEQVYTCSQEHHVVPPPIRVTVALVSRWGPGDFYERTDRQVSSFNLVTMGNMFYRQSGNCGIVAPGELFIAQKGQDQRFETGSAGFLHKRSILVEGIGLDALMQVTGLTTLDRVTFDDPVEVTQLFRRCYRLMRDKPSGFASELSVLAYAIVNKCCQSVAAKHPPPIRAAIEFMEKNLKFNPGLPEIAAAAGLSPRNLMRLFRAHLAESPRAFLIGLKMNAAKAMLMHSALNIKQIGLELGYEDQFHFSSQFKLRTGRSPRAFRLSYQQSPPADKFVRTNEKSRPTGNRDS